MPTIPRKQHSRGSSVTPGISNVGSKLENKTIGEKIINNSISSG